MSDNNERNNFINDNIGLVHLCAQRYTGRGIEYDDLFQAGCLGLVKAYDRFDRDRGIKFSTYAVPVILGEMRQLFRSGGTVKIGRALKERSIKAVKVREEFFSKNGREPTVNELAAIMEIEPSQAAEAVTASLPTISLTSDDDSGGGQNDIPTENFDEGIIDLIALRQVICELEGDDRKIINLRYFCGKTQVQTANELGMTQVQISRREKKIISNLKSKMCG